MLDTPFRALLVALRDCGELTDVELATVTTGDWTFEHVPRIRCDEDADLYWMAALALHVRADVVSGSPEWLAWFKSPQGALHACLTARLIQWEERGDLAQP